MEGGMILTRKYRIMRHTDEKPVWYGLHEVFYDEDGAVVGWTHGPVTGVYDSVSQLEKSLEKMVRDVQNSKYDVLLNEEPVWCGLHAF